MTGAFHQLVDSWPVDVEDGGYVRLYKQDEKLMALVSEPQRIRLIVLDSDGAVLEEQVLLRNRWLDIAPFTVGLATVPDGTRYLSGVRKRERSGMVDEQVAILVAFDDQGTPLHRSEHTMLLDLQEVADQLPDYDPEAAIQGLLLWEGAYDNLMVNWDGGELLLEGFASENLDEWRTWGCAAVTANEATVEVGEVVVEPGQFMRREVEPASNSLVLETDFTSISDVFSVHLAYNPMLCVDGITSQVLYAIGEIDELRLGVYTKVDGGAFVISDEEQQYQVVPGLPYTLRWDVEESAARVTVTSPMVWSQSLESDDPINLTGLTSVEDYLVFATAGGGYATRVENLGFSQALPLDANASEVRSWETVNGWRLGVCLPERHQIRIGPTEVVGSGRFVRLTWPFQSTRALTNLVLGGSSVGQGQGEFLFPLSFDVSPDGRIFVLDAGNGRIQSFVEDGAYMSEWGSPGSGADEFDFGSGIAPTDFAGSLVVDDDGFIYVADVGNKRIQKFAP